MQGAKASYLEERCQSRNQNFLRFDYTGHGMSSGAFKDGTIGAWLQDALDVFDTLTEGPQILVGSSMGGWIAFLLALRRQERIAGMIGVAAAPDFSEDVYNHVFGIEERKHLEQTGLIYLPTTGDPHPMTRTLFEDGRKHLILQEKFSLPCPVRLIHGKNDDTVPWRKAEKIREQLASPDLKIIWIEDGDHRLSRPQDLKIIDEAVRELSLAHQMKSLNAAVCD